MLRPSAASTSGWKRTACRWIPIASPDGAIDVYRLPTGLFVDLQTDLIFHLTTRMTAPLLPVVGGPMQASRLNPIFEIDGERYALHPQLMAAVPTRILRRPIDNLDRHYDAIVAAIDMVFLGF